MQTHYADEYGEHEATHWWFRARRVILQSLLAREISWPPGARAVEIGVGPGMNLYALYPDHVDVCGVEPDPLNSERARKLGPKPVYTGTIEALPPPVATQTFDAVCLFDVLEHIERDGDALDILRARLKPGGSLALSVPAYPWLWGRQDVVSMHYRRYTMGSLRNLVEKHGFRVAYATYFMTWLLPVVAGIRLAHRLVPSRGDDVKSDFSYGPPWLDNLLYRIFRSEAAALRHVRFPAGVSIFLVARAP